MNKRIFGIIGLIGSIILFAGDMLLYGHFGSAGDIYDIIEAAVPHVSVGQLFVGGIIGPIAAFLYIAGFYHVYLNIQRAGKKSAKVVFVSSSLMMAIGGTYHALWTIRMLLFKFRVMDVENLQPFVEAVNSYLNLILMTSTILGYIAFTLLLILVLIGKTNYRRWTVIVNPGLLYLMTLLSSEIPGPLGAVIVGGYINLIFILFFSISVITTWRVDSDI